MKCWGGLSVSARGAEEEKFIRLYSVQISYREKKIITIEFIWELLSGESKNCYEGHFILIYTLHGQNYEDMQMTHL